MLKLFVVRQDRSALSDGRVIERTNVAMNGGWEYEWQCVCRPEENHDHEALIGVIAAGLANREQVLPGIASLVGQEIVVGNTKATITDANIQIRGPLNWDTYVAWKYDDGRMEEKVYSADDPLKSPTAAAVHEHVNRAVSVNEARAIAARAAAAFTGEVSDPDPIAVVPSNWAK